MDHKVYLVLLALMVKTVQQDQLGQKDHKARKDFPVKTVHRGHKVQQDQRALMV